MRSVAVEHLRPTHFSKTASVLMVRSSVHVYFDQLAALLGLTYLAKPADLSSELGLGVVICQGIGSPAFYGKDDVSFKIKQE